MNKMQMMAVGALLAAGTALGGVRTNDYAWVRGTHYGPGGDPEQLVRELGYGRRVGLNATRFWLGRGAWNKDPKGYVERVRAFVRIAWENGYYSMPILFNGNMINPKMLDDGEWANCAAYAKDIVLALKDEPGILMWDVMNEPTCNPWVNAQKDKTEKERRRQKTWAFLRRACAHVRALDPGSPITVGYTTAYEAEPTVSCVDVISFHDYSSTRARQEANFALAESLGKKYGKPVIQTETGCLARSNPYDMALEACERHKMGWFLFNLMIRGRCDSEHGVFYPDGTVRDPATVAAMMGCFRCRDTSMIIPGLANREGSAKRAVEKIHKALTEYTSDAFDYRPSSVKELLEASEHAANLLECCELVPMAIPPTARIAAWRKMEKPPLAEIRRFAYELALELEKACQLL